MSQSDSELQQAVLQELEWDIRVDEAVPGPSARIDTDVAQVARNAPHCEEFVPEQQIRSGTTNGALVLEREAEDRDQREVRHAIKAALEHRARRGADHVHVEFVDGCARLTGRVRSWSAWKIIHDAALFTPGVRTVDDQILVDSSLL